MVNHFNRDSSSRLLAPDLSRRTALLRLGGGLAAALALVAGSPRTVAQNATATTIPSLFEEWVAIWGRDPNRADALYASDAVLEDVTAGAVFRGRDEVKAHVEDEFAGFPDHAYELINAFVAGNRAAAEFRWTGTYTGTYPGLPSGAGQAVSLRGTVFIELAAEKIQYEAHYYDAYTLLIQLGVLPAPGAAATPRS